MTYLALSNLSNTDDCMLLANSLTITSKSILDEESVPVSGAIYDDGDLAVEIPDNGIDFLCKSKSLASKFSVTSFVAWLALPFMLI